MTQNTGHALPHGAAAGDGTSTPGDQSLFDPAEHITAVASGYGERLTAVRARIDAYHPDCQRRYAIDTSHDAARALRGAAAWLAGDYDQTYAGPHPSFGTTVQDFRVHYADDALRRALHHLVWAEHYAGLRSRDSARSADPFR